MRATKRQSILGTILLAAMSLSGIALPALADDDTETTTVAQVTFLPNAQVSVTVGELYSGQTGAVGIGSASVDMPWMDPWDEERSLPHDDASYSTEVRERTIADLWHTGAFRTKNGKSPKYSASYSINGGPAAEGAQTVEVENLQGTSTVRVTFTPPPVTESQSESGYCLQAGQACIAFSVSETTASGTYPVAITTEIRANNFDPN